MSDYPGSSSDPLLGPALCPIRPIPEEGVEEERVLEEDEDEEGDEHPAEEARRAKKARDPGAPSRAEVEAHEATHLPIRIWCEVCVAGRRDNPAHLRVPREPGGVPEVGFDYAFMRRETEEETVTLLVMKDRDSRATRAWVVPVKGADMQHAVQRAVEGVHDLGHRGPVVIKTDNEPAVLALREAIMKELHEGALPVQPTPGESESNGVVESGVRLFKGLLRVHLAALERKTEVVFPCEHPVTAWLAGHVSDVLTKSTWSGPTAIPRTSGCTARPCAKKAPSSASASCSARGARRT